MTLKTTLTGRLGAAILFCGAAYGAAVPAAAFKAPAAFEPNRGQAPKQIDYLAKGFGYSIGIAATRTQVAFGPSTAPHFISLQFEGAQAAQAQALDPLKHTSSYFYGDRSITQIPTFERVRYANVYDGIDVVYYGKQDRFEYDLVVAPGADPKAIQLRFEGVDSVKRSKSGDLLLNSGDDQMMQRKPAAYQMFGARRVTVAANYRVARNGSVEIALGKYDHSKELVIDPILLFKATGNFKGGIYLRNGSVTGAAVATDNLGNYTYLASTTIPSFNSAGTVSANNVYVERFDNNGTLAGSSQVGLRAQTANFYAAGIALDSDNSIYLTGYTDDTQSGSLGVPSGGQDAVLFVLNSAFTAQTFTRYIGGAGNDRATGIAVDQNTQGVGGPSTGIAYVVGTSTSSNFPAGSPAGAQHGFVYAVNTKTGAVVYSTALGGSGTDAANGVAVDASGNAYVGGATTSPNFSPVVGGSGFSTTKSGTSNDGFVVKLNSGGSPAWSSFFPNGPINAIAQLTCAVPNCGTNGTFAYVTGTSSGPLTTTANAYRVASPAGTGADHAFFAKFDTNSAALPYSTYLGGQATDAGLGIAVQVQTGIGMIVGSTTSADFASSAAGAYSVLQSTFNGPQDGFITYLNPGVSGLPGLVYSTLRGSQLLPDTTGSRFFVQLTGIATDFYGEASISATVSNAVGPVNFAGQNSTGLAIKLGSPIWVPTTYVTQLYADLLDRQPDPSGLAFWLSVLSAGNSRAYVAASIANSPEFNQWGLAIVKDYLGILNRIPDYPGYSGNFNAALAPPNDTASVNAKIANVQAIFLASAEFQNIYAADTTFSGYISHAFSNILLRAPSQVELNANLGKTRNQVIIDLVASAEFNNRIFAPAYANLMYMALLRRTASDPSGLAFWTGVLANPNLLQTVIQNFSTSQEYFNRFQ